MSDLIDDLDFSLIRSKDFSEFPMWALLIIYEKAKSVSYVEYMQGFKLLTRWLSPINKFTTYHPISKAEFLNTYEINRVARILNTPQETIVSCLLTEALPKIYLRDIT